MGHYADKFPGKTKENFQNFYLNTGDKSNFSRKYLFYVLYILSTVCFTMSTDNM